MKYWSSKDTLKLSTRGLHGPGLSLISAQPETKYKILAGSDRPNQFFSPDFGLDRLELSDFKTDPFSCLHTVS